MIPLRLRVENFLSYGSPPALDLSEVDVACLSGPNGSGKSALLDAITWACWGQARGCEGGQNQDRLIREGADETAADLTFDLGGSVYRIIRRRARGKKSQLQFMVRAGEDWTNIAGETLRETEAKIAGVLRMDYRTFVASALFLQGRSEDLLARMRPEERKEIFASLLGLGAYERLEDAARAKAREAEGERKAAEGFAEQITEQAGRAEGLETDLSVVAKELEAATEAEQELAQALDGQREVLTGFEKGEAALSAERKALASATNRASGARSDLAKAAKELAAIEKVLARRGDLEHAKAAAGDLERAKILHSAQVAEEASAQERIKNLDSEVEELRKKFEILKRGEGECPLCGGRLDAEHADEVRKSIEAEGRAKTKAKEKAERARQEARKAARGAAEEIARLEREVAKGDKLEGAISQAEDGQAAAAARLEALESQISDLVAEAEAKSKAVEALEAQLEGMEAARRQLGAVTAELEAARSHQMQLKSQEARLQERLKAARKAGAELDAARRREVEAATTRRRYLRLAAAFGRGGIPDLIIDNARPELEEDARAVLDDLTSGEMSVHFQLQRQTRDGKARDTFDVQVFADGGLRDFAMFSGGEAFRIAFAVRLAMSKLLTRRAGARLETLVIDEGFGTQDPEGRERLVEAINLARRQFAKVLVITHLDDLRDQFGTQIRVTKGPEGSTFELEGELAGTG